MPEYEPRGCPRGASFSWYTYSPLRLRYPYVRGSLIEMFREARARLGDPVEAWAEIVDDPERSRRYKRERGKGGFVRASWDEVTELIAAAHVHTIKRYGPDRVVGFSPIPAMSMASYAAGTRFLSLIGGVILSFYDWYADLPPSSPQVFGDQTDVPESGRLVERGLSADLGHEPADDPDAGRALHGRGALSRPEGRGRLARLRGAHEVRRSLAGGGAGLRRRAGDGDGARDPEGVLRRSRDAVLPRLRAAVHRSAAAGDVARARRTRYVPDRLLRASDLGGAHAAQEHADWKTVVLDERTGEPAVPNGSVGHRYARVRRRTLEPAAGRDRARADAARARARARRGRPAALRRRRGRGRRDRAPRRAGDADRRTARDDGARPRARAVRRRRATGCRATGRRATTTPSSRARPRGRSRSPASTGVWRRGWRASSRATPR